MSSLMKTMIRQRHFLVKTLFFTTLLVRVIVCQPSSPDQSSIRSSDVPFEPIESNQLPVGARADFGTIPQKFLHQTPSILYTAVVRGKVALPCDINPPTPDDSVALILWYKDDALAPIYTLDARKGYLDQARSLTSSILDGRANFNLHNRPAFLHIDPIRLNDAGDYRCRVDFKKARTINTVISLKVIVPPDEPVISDMDGNELKGLVGPFNEGDSLRLLCSSSGGQPRPSLTWWRDYSTIDDSFEYNEKDVAMNQLTIPTLARHHLLSIFTCQAVNNNITVPASTSITLDLNLKATEVKITQLTPTLVADNQAVLECTAFGSRPKAVIHWLFDGQRMTTPLATGSFGEHQTSTTITIKPTAENPKIPGSAVSDTIKLDVQSPPRLSLQLGSPTLSLHKIQEGNDIYFDCHIVSNPRPNKPISWKRNGLLLPPGPGVIQSNQSLVLQKVSKEQKGAYQCEASNSQGTAVSNTIHLKIRYAPVCIDENVVYTFGVTLHETVRIPCQVDANPPQVSFSWKFQGSLDLTSFVQTNETSSMLTYTPHAPQEYGSIECKGKNDVGLQQKSCKYQIIPAAPPSFPFTCQVVNHSFDSLTIQCVFDSSEIGSSNNGNNNGNGNNSWNANHLFPAEWHDRPRKLVHPRTWYVCEVYHLTSSTLVANVTTSIAEEFSSSSMSSSPLPKKSEGLDNGSFQFVISHLSSETTLRLRLYAKNSKGSSDSTWIRAQTLRPPERLNSDVVDTSHSDGVLSLNDNSDSGGNNGNSGSTSNSHNSFIPSGISASSLLQQTHLISLVIGFFVVSSSAILFGILLLVKFRKSRRRSSTTSCSLMGSNLTSSNLRDSPDEMSSDSSENLKRGHDVDRGGDGHGIVGGGPGSYYSGINNDNSKCTCCDEFCDDPNSMTSATGVSHRHNDYENAYHRHHGGERPAYSANIRPPDMIPPSYNSQYSHYSTIPTLTTTTTMSSSHHPVPTIHTCTEVSEDDGTSMSDHVSITGPIGTVFSHLTDKSFVTAFGNELEPPTACPPDMIPSSFVPSSNYSTTSSSQLDQHSSTDGTHLVEFDKIYQQKLELVEPESLQYVEVSFAHDHSPLPPSSTVTTTAIDGRTIHLIPTSIASSTGSGGTLTMVDQLGGIMSSTLPRIQRPPINGGGGIGGGLNVDYARIEFNSNNKKSRVSVMSGGGGSPKFESTV